MSVLFIFSVSLFSIVFSYEDYSEDWDPVYDLWGIPPFDAHPIEYTEFSMFNSFPGLLPFEEGQPMSTLEESVVESLLSKMRLCDITKHYDNNKTAYWMTNTYSPAICSSQCHPGQAITGGANFTTNECKKAVTNGVCCPASEVPFFSSKFPNKVLFKTREPAKPAFVKHNPMTSVEFEKMRGTQLNIDNKQHLLDPDFRLEVKHERVCGVRMRKVYSKNGTTLPDNNLAYDKIFSFYLCTEPEECSIPDQVDDRTADPKWHKFCQSNVFRSSAQLELAKTTCCHHSQLKSDSFSPQFKNLQLTELPFFLKFSPGVRSNFMCSQYAQYVCDGANDGCGLKSEAGDGFASIKEFPHMARLGIIGRRVLLFHCLGALISRRYIMSTWSCREMYGLATNIVLLGDDNTKVIAPGETQYFIIEIRNPYLENYTPLGDPPLMFEVALYKTHKDIQFSPTIRPACIYYSPQIRPLEALYAYFGKLGNITATHRLRKITMQLHGTIGKQESYHYLCNKKIIYKNNRFLQDSYGIHGASLVHQFCGNNIAKPKDGPCKFDRGGPLTIRLQEPYCMWQVIGVLSSTSWYCFGSDPNVFNNITYFVGMIEDIVWPLPFLDAEVPKPACNLPSQSYWWDAWDQ